MQNELTPTPGMSFSALRPGGRVSFSAVALEDCVLERMLEERRSSD